MRHVLGLFVLCGALALTGCQQTQEAADDEDGETTVIEEEETVVPAPPAAPADAPDVDVKMEGGEQGASGEVSVEDN